MSGLHDLPRGCFEERFVRAGGHGGQNVNKVATSVQLRFFPALSGLPFQIIDRLRALAGSRLTAEGDIVITASEHRTQEQNRRAARERLAELLSRASRPPKRRRPTKPTFGSKLRRLESKKKRSDIKRSRGGDFD